MEQATEVMHRTQDELQALNAELTEAQLSYRYPPAGLPRNFHERFTASIAQGGGGPLTDFDIQSIQNISGKSLGELFLEMTEKRIIVIKRDCDVQPDGTMFTMNHNMAHEVGQEATCASRIIQTHRVAYFGSHETDLAFLVADTSIAEDPNDGKVTVAVWYPGVEEGPHQVVVDYRYFIGDTLKHTMNYLTGARTIPGKPWTKAKRGQYDQEQRNRIEEYLDGTVMPSPIRGAFSENHDGDVGPINILESTIFKDYNLDLSAFKTVSYYDRYTLPQEVVEVVERVQEHCSKTDILPLSLLKIGVLNW
ncbi:hypothetical protein PG984_009744 [Apiospora sp. TS-2023a]